ncbi:MAG: DUF423 domain-containing protein [Bacteroidota bacterium]
MDRFFFVLGSISAFIGVAVGAFGAHALREKLSPELLNAFEVGVRYQIYHALAILAVAWAASHWLSSNVAVAGWLFFAGTVLFSGSLYALSLTGLRWLGLVTPVGGLMFLAGWIYAAWVIFRTPVT